MIDEACLARAEDRARATYRAPGRCYHDERHLADCLEQLERTTGLQDKERRLLRWAILWHDCIYEPGRADNEERSASLASSDLLACGVPRQEAAEVERLILLTSSHAAAEHDRLGAALVSIDLSILGAEAKQYRDYAEGVRREYAHLPDETWRRGRAAVLERLLATHPLFPDRTFRERLEAQARNNLKAELSSLRAG